MRGAAASTPPFYAALNPPSNAEPGLDALLIASHATPEIGVSQLRILLAVGFAGPVWDLAGPWRDLGPAIETQEKPGFRHCCWACWAFSPVGATIGFRGVQLPKARKAKFFISNG